jgi:hypothetical protein
MRSSIEFNVLQISRDVFRGFSPIRIDALTASILEIELLSQPAWKVASLAIAGTLTDVE